MARIAHIVCQKGGGLVTENQRQRGRADRTRRQPEKSMSRRERRRLVRLTVSGVLLILVIAVKLLMPDLAGAYRDKLLGLMSESTDFAEAFSAVGKAFSKEGGIRDTLEDAYVAVFGEKKPEEAASPSKTAADVFSGLYTAENLPAQTELCQRVLGFAYAPPLQGDVTSGFGYRVHPIAGENRFHYGVDIGAQEGTDIRAFAGGTVGVVAQSSELGNYVTVNHPDGFSTLYAHCKCVTATAGQTVRRGDVLAQVGQTGVATGPHLHFELHWEQIYLNPIYYAL